MHRKSNREKNIDRLIPQAEKRADARVLDLLEETRSESKQIDYDAVWTRYFHDEMNKITGALGLRRLVPRAFKPRIPYACQSYLH